MHHIGIDIGSAAAKTVVFEDGKEIYFFEIPTGWSTRETAAGIKSRLLKHGLDIEIDNVKVIATGFGQAHVPYADKRLPEILCHGKGGYFLINEDCTIIDIGGRETNIITVENAEVKAHLSSDKCASATGKFLEIMANRLDLDILELFDLAIEGSPIESNSKCAVFAESDIAGYIGEGYSNKDIAAGVVDSVAARVAALALSHGIQGKCLITGGLGSNHYFASRLKEKIGLPVYQHERGKYAGAIGAALIGRETLK